MNKLPDPMPANTAEAFAQISATKTPTLDALKLMVLVEASGQGYYGALADAAPNEAIRAVFARNGQEELAHAHRVARVIKRLYDEEFEVPAPQDNPYYARPAGLKVTRDFLGKFAAGERGGEQLYEDWASGLADAEAAKLLRQNGKEEARHGERLEQAIGLLP